MKKVILLILFLLITVSPCYSFKKSTATIITPSYIPSEGTKTYFINSEDYDTFPDDSAILINFKIVLDFEVVSITPDLLENLSLKLYFSEGIYQIEIPIPNHELQFIDAINDIVEYQISEEDFTSKNFNQNKTFCHSFGFPIQKANQLWKLEIQNNNSVDLFLYQWKQEIEYDYPDLVVKNAQLLHPLDDTELTQVKMGEAVRIKSVLENIGDVLAVNDYSYSFQLIKLPNQTISQYLSLRVDDYGAGWPGNIIEKIQNYTIPNGITEGQYCIRILVDVNGTVNESLNENNNYYDSAPFEILPLYPDLVINSIHTSNSANANQDIIVEIEISNNGIADVATGFYCLLELCDQNGNVIDSLNEWLPFIYLQPNSIKFESIQYTLPADIPSGNYQIKLSLDKEENFIRELNEENNTNSVNIQINNYPDLKVQSLKLYDSSDNEINYVHPGEHIKLEIKILNDSFIDCPNYCLKVELRHWQHNIIQEIEIQNNMNGLSALGTYLHNIDYIFPENLDLTFYYIHIYLDYTQNIKELDENNNSGNIMFQLKNYPDICINNFKATNYEGEIFGINNWGVTGDIFNIEFDVLNIGAHITADEIFLCAVVLKADNSDVEILLHDFTITGPFDLLHKELQLNFPTNIPDANYKILCIADYENKIRELNTDNNIKFSDSFLLFSSSRPDLQVESFTILDNDNIFNTGELLSFEACVKNIGDDQSHNNTIKLYWGNKDEPIGASFAEFFNNEVLEPYAEKTYTLSKLIPNITGEKYLWLHIDAGYEGSHTANNWKRSQSSVSIFKETSITNLTSTDSYENRFIISGKLDGLDGVNFSPQKIKITIQRKNDYNVFETIPNDDVVETDIGFNFSWFPSNPQIYPSGYYRAVVTYTGSEYVKGCSSFVKWDLSKRNISKIHVDNANLIVKNNQIYNECNITATISGTGGFKVTTGRVQFEILDSQGLMGPPNTTYRIGTPVTITSGSDGQVIFQNFSGDVYDQNGNLRTLVINEYESYKIIANYLGSDFWNEKEFNSLLDEEGLLKFTANFPPETSSQNITYELQNQTYPFTDYIYTMRPYVISAKFFDKNGSNDIEFVYLAIKHPESDVLELKGTVAENQCDIPEEIELLNFNTQSIEENGIEGIEARWIFRIKHSWNVSSAKGIKLGIKLQDKEMIKVNEEGEYVWDDSNASLKKLSLESGKWTIIIHGKSVQNGFLYTEFPPWENTISQWFDLHSTPYSNFKGDMTFFDDFNDYLDFHNHWIGNLAIRLKYLSNSNVKIHRIQHHSFDIQTFEEDRGGYITDYSAINDNSSHHILLFDWNQPSDFFTIDSSVGDTDNWYAYASGDALYAFIKKSNIADKISTLIGYSRGAVVASEASKRLLRDNDTNSFQIIYLDGEGFHHNHVSLGLGNYYDWDFHAWKGLRTDQYRSVNGSRYGLAIYGRQFFVLGGNPLLEHGNDRIIQCWPEYSIFNNKLVDGYNRYLYLMGENAIFHSYYPEYLIEQFYLAWDSNLNQICLETTNLWEDDKNTYDTLASPNNGKVVDENIPIIFNGSFDDDSLAGWLYHGGFFNPDNQSGPIPVITPMYSDTNPLGSYLKLDPDHSIIIHNWMVLPNGNQNITLYCESMANRFTNLEASRIQVRWLGEPNDDYDTIYAKSDIYEIRYPDSISFKIGEDKERVGRLCIKLLSSTPVYIRDIQINSTQPTVANLNVNPDPVNQRISLVATDVQDNDGIQTVKFYLDFDNDTQFNSSTDLFLGKGTLQTDNNWILSCYGDYLHNGNNTIFAIAYDLKNVESEPIIATINFVKSYNYPKIEAITSNVDDSEIFKNNLVYFTLTNVSDNTEKVCFYRDDGSNAFEKDYDEFLLETNDWNNEISYSSEILPNGVNKIFAVPYDNDGIEGIPVSCSFFVNQMCNVELIVSPAGSAEILSPTSGEYEYGTRIYPELQMQKGYRFVRWEINDAETNMPYILKENVLIKAVMEELLSTPPIISELKFNNEIYGTETSIEVFASDNDGPDYLIYHWELKSGPKEVSFINNDDYSSKRTIKFSKAGTYTFKVKAYDGLEYSDYETCTVNVNQSLKDIEITPSLTVVDFNSEHQFLAHGFDQFDNLIENINCNWNIDFGEDQIIDNDGICQNGIINLNTGLLTTGALEGGPYTITVTSNDISSIAEFYIKNVTQINDFTPGDQRYPSISYGNDNYLVTWSSKPQDGSGSGVYGKLYSADLSTEINVGQINSTIKNDQIFSSVASDGTNYLVVWEDTSNLIDNEGSAIYGQFILFDGNKHGTEFLINEYTSNYQSLPRLASNKNNYLVVWSSYAQDNSDWGIYGRIFDNNGLNQNNHEFKINSNKIKSQWNAEIASNGNNYLVVWSSYDQDGSCYGVYGQIIDSLGQAVGQEIEINSYTAGYQWGAKVASNGNDYLVVWTGINESGEYNIMGRYIDNDGNLNKEFVINNNCNKSCWATSVVATEFFFLPIESFYIVAWLEESTKKNEFLLYCKYYFVDKSLSAYTNAENLPIFITSFSDFQPTYRHWINSNFIASRKSPSYKQLFTVWNNYDLEQNDYDLFGADIVNPFINYFLDETHDLSYEIPENDSFQNYELTNYSILDNDSDYGNSIDIFINSLPNNMTTDSAITLTGTVKNQDIDHPITSIEYQVDSTEGQWTPVDITEEENISTVNWETVVSNLSYGNSHTFYLRVKNSKNIEKIEYYSFFSLKYFPQVLGQFPFYWTITATGTEHWIECPDVNVECKVTGQGQEEVGKTAIQWFGRPFLETGSYNWKIIAHSAFAKGTLKIVQYPSGRIYQKTHYNNSNSIGTSSSGSINLEEGFYDIYFEITSYRFGLRTMYFNIESVREASVVTSHKLETKLKHVIKNGKTVNAKESPKKMWDYDDARPSPSIPGNSLSNITYTLSYLSSNHDFFVSFAPQDNVCSTSQLGYIYAKTSSKNHSEQRLISQNGSGECSANQQYETDFDLGKLPQNNGSISNFKIELTNNSSDYISTQLIYESTPDYNISGTLKASLEISPPIISFDQTEYHSNIFKIFGTAFDMDNIIAIEYQFDSTNDATWLLAEIIAGENTSEVQWKIQTPPVLSDGNHTLYVRAKDSDGYISLPNKMSFIVGDSDRDGLSDWEEIFIYKTDARKNDTDGDRLDDGKEIFTYHTSPFEDDSDNDGLYDYDEIFYLFTSALNSDSDNDGLNDNAEIFTYGSDPLSEDSDNDSLSDLQELTYLQTNLLNSDTDDDGLTDKEEIDNNTDPLMVDSDNDGLSDWMELVNFHTNPLLSDTDDDGLLDGEELFRSNIKKKLISYYESQILNPKASFCNEKYLITWLEKDEAQNTIYGQYLTITGDKTGNTFLIAEFANSNNRPFYSLTNNGIQYFLCWTEQVGEEYYVFGIISDNEGNFSQNKFPINSTGQNYQISSASNGTDFLISYTRVEGFPKIYYQIIKSTGTVLSPKKVSTTDNIHMFPFCSSNKDNFLISWGGDILDNSKNIFVSGVIGQYIDKDGNMIGSNFCVAHSGFKNISTPLKDNYLISYNKSSDLYAQLISANQVLINDAIQITDFFNNYYAEFSLSSTSKNALSIWSSKNSGENIEHVYGQFILSNQKKFYSNFLIIPPQNYSQFSPCIESDGKNYLIAWIDSNHAETSISYKIFNMGYGTDPNNYDTDNDGLPDGSEIFITNTNPLIYDGDNDGLSDGEEIIAYQTDPFKADTDNDGLSDGSEQFEHLTNPLLKDTDNDGLIDGEEIAYNFSEVLFDSINPTATGEVQIASNGRNFILMWSLNDAPSDGSRNEHGIYLQLFDCDGVPIDAPKTIATSFHNDLDNPCIESDGNFYLVTWHEKDNETGKIYGQFLSKNAEQINAPFFITKGSNFSIFYGLEKYLLCYYDEGSLWGKFINRDTSYSENISFRITNDFFASYGNPWYTSPSIEINLDDFFIVYEADGFFPGSFIDICGSSIGKYGEILEEKIQINQLTDSLQFFPKITSNENTIFISWQSYEGLYGTIFSKTSLENQFEQEFKIANISSPPLKHCVINTKNNFNIFWNYLDDFQRLNVHCQRINYQGSLIGLDHKINSSNISVNSPLTCANIKNKCIVSWIGSNLKTNEKGIFYSFFNEGTGSDPTISDTDNDGYTDYEEVINGTNPSNPESSAPLPIVDAGENLKALVGENITFAGTVNFPNNDQNSYLITWDFGDGEDITDILSPTHTYTTPGTYIATLTVGEIKDTVTIFIEDYMNLSSIINLNEPMGIGTDEQGNLYVADSMNYQIQVFDNDALFLKKWGQQGSNDGEFNYPVGIAVSNSGNIYVADQYNHRIQKFNHEGTFIKSWGSFGENDGEFDTPMRLAVNGLENVYVVDFGNNRIQVFDNDGNFINKWGTHGNSEGQFDSPRGIAIDIMQNVYVSDTNNNRIQKFNSNGIFIQTIVNSVNSPRGLDIDNFGNIIVVEYDNHKLKIFDEDGNYWAGWGTQGYGDFQFRYPRDVAVDKNNYIYVADGLNNRVLKFAISNNKPTVYAGQDMICLEGELITFTGSYQDDINQVDSISWDFGDGEKDNSGCLIINHTFSDEGIYTVTLHVFDVHGNESNDTLLVKTLNVAPTVDIGSDVNIEEGTTVNFTGSFYDPGIFDTHIIEWDFGDEEKDNSGSLTPIHIYHNSGYFTVNLTIQDNDGGIGKDCLQVMVGQSPPIVHAGTDQNINEGDIVNFTGSYTNPMNVDISYIEWDFGDGEKDNSGVLNLTHSYLDDGIYNVELTIVDNEGRMGSDSLIVNVKNQNPNIIINSNNIFENLSVNLEANISDAGILDTHILKWDFGDGEKDNSGNVNINHSYNTNGIYKIKAKVIDDDGGMSETEKVILVKINPNASLGGYDLNKDGYLDIVLSNHQEGSNVHVNSYIFLGSDSGYNFENKIELPTKAAMGNSIVDLNGDGYLDIIFCNYYADGSYITTSYIYWGAEEGYSTENRTELPTMGAFACAVADLNSDNYLDIVFSNHIITEENYTNFGINSYIYWGSEEGFLPDNKMELPTFGARGISIADANNDGYLDVLFSNYYPQYNVGEFSYLYLGNESGFSSENRILFTTKNASDNSIIDLNRDGYMDVIFSSYNGNGSTIYWGDENGFSDDNNHLLPATKSWTNSIEDINGDGYLDVLISAEPSRIYWGTEIGFSEEYMTELNYNYATVNVLCDLNYDGYWDLLSIDHELSASWIYWGTPLGYQENNRSSLPFFNVSGASAGNASAWGHSLPPIAKCSVIGNLVEGESLMFDASSSFDPNGSSISINWDLDNDNIFNDATSTTINLDNSQPGSHSVKVQVMNSFGLSSTIEQNYFIENIPPLVDAGSDQTVNEGEIVYFTGTFNDYSLGNEYLIEWNFGDGLIDNSGTLNTSHVYQDEGLYSVSLTIKDNYNLQNTDTLIVDVKNSSPMVFMHSEATMVNEGEEIEFSGYYFDPGINDIHSIEWDFGNGYIIKGTLNPRFYFLDNGLQEVFLTIKDNDGGVGVSKLTLQINNVPPTVEINGEQIIKEGESITLLANYFDPGFLDTHRFKWDFGDGEYNNDGEFITNHQYFHKGNYNISLIVEDDDGDTGVANLVLEVIDLPPQVKNLFINDDQEVEVFFDAIPTRSYEIWFSDDFLGDNTNWQFMDTINQTYNDSIGYFLDEGDNDGFDNITDTQDDRLHPTIIKNRFYKIKKIE